MAGGATSVKGSQRTGVTSYKTYVSSQTNKSKALSKRSVNSIAGPVRTPIQETPIAEAELDDELEAKPEDFSNCNSCPR